MMKKKIALLLAMLLVISTVLCACGSEKEDPTPTPGGNTDVENDDVTGLLEAPVLLISVGQSADISIAKSLMTKANIEFAEYTDGMSFDGYKSVMLVPGVSVKGLGSAGISVDDELKATKDLVAALNSSDIKVLVAHLGGSSRRDELTDQFIDVVLPEADVICALEEGNKDGKFTDFAKANGTPCAIAKDIVSMVSIVTDIYSK